MLPFLPFNNVSPCFFYQSFLLCHNSFVSCLVLICLKFILFYIQYTFYGSVLFIFVYGRYTICINVMFVK